MYFYPSAFQRIESGLNAPFWSADNYKNLPWLSQGIFWGKKYFTVFLFSPFVLFPVLDDEFSPSHVAEPKVGFVAVSSLGIQHCPERLSPSERSAKKIKQNLSSLVTAGSKTFTKVAATKPHPEHGAGFCIGSLEQRRHQI